MKGRTTAPARLTGEISDGCGGLCPGLNNVIRSIVLAVTHGYGVKRIFGFRYGYARLSSTTTCEPLELSPEVVEDIHEQGGTLLGSSRGPRDLGDMVNNLAQRGVSLLVAVGGDGTLKGASALVREIGRRRLPIAVVGVPKTIDNDILWVERSFGFATAVEEAARAIAGAHAGARGAWNGIGLVKLMGRQSGFIAAHSALTTGDVNFCLIPEVPFDLDGDRGFFKALERRIAARHHAVVVVAEGAGQDVVAGERPATRDGSGNMRPMDVGRFLQERVPAHFRSRGIEATLKYIDPSYLIRSVPANAHDAEFCLLLGQQAVHAGMAGRTDLMIGFWNQRFVHVPITLAVRERRRIDPAGSVWRQVIEATGQPVAMRGEGKE